MDSDALDGRAPGRWGHEEARTGGFQPLTGSLLEKSGGQRFGPLVPGALPHLAGPRSPRCSL